MINPKKDNIRSLNKFSNNSKDQNWRQKKKKEKKK